MISSLVGKRVAVIGIGNELNADDAAGVLVARRLAAWKDPAREDILVIDAGPAPENFSSTLRRFRPEIVILVDAAEMGQPPGVFSWVPIQEVEGFSGSTHILSPGVFARFLISETGCEVLFVGIQPACLGFDQPVSKPVLSAVEEITGELGRSLSFSNE